MIFKNFFNKYFNNLRADGVELIEARRSILAASLALATTPAIFVVPRQTTTPHLHDERNFWQSYRLIGAQLK